MAEEEVAGAELPLDSAGAKLLRAREAAGLTQAELSAITRIPARSLAAIEAGNFAALPARMYAVGFSRTYARAVGLDEQAIVAEVRAEMAAQLPDDARRAAVTFEPGDPARVPSPQVAWLAALAAVVVLLLVYAFWRSYLAPAGALPSLLPTDQPAEGVPAAAAPVAAPAQQAAGGPVVFTALEQGVWVKFYDGAGNQLLQKELALGESYTVPSGMADVQLWTARPNALGVTIGGQAVPKLSDVQKTMKDVPVTAVALLARGAAPAVVPATTPDAAAPIRAVQRSQPAPRRTAAPATRPAAGSGDGEQAAPVPSPAATPADPVTAPPNTGL
ncbi:helix-turn-helix domain-containing protein [Novosphingobium sp.]|uniref:helix-turn-helix domain-containing protein n=1 Tax=Novosphingobium sp. TaxID=1874826 RepID=UPI0027368023|nr:RodZ domain-containing protein [Novosphingobium sp.]MDP3907877.1 DUF4115 domain-containing protein [Novosphingobium sp.]